MNLYWKYLLLGIVISLSACEEPTTGTTGAYKSGVFVVNEGIFGQTSGTITHYDRSTGTATQKIFNQANNRDLGDVVQSMTFHNDKAYIVVNNSNKIEVADAVTFEEKAQITGLRLPRYLMPISNSKAYVSEWGADGLTGTIAVLDLITNTISNRISVGRGPEGLLLKDNKMYIAHAGGYGDNNIITVIDTQTDQVATTITVYDRPSRFVEDNDGNIWVACSGKVVYTTYPTIDTANSTASALIKIDPTTNAIVNTLSFGKGKPVGNLTMNSINQGELYYSREGKVWKYTIATGQEMALWSGSFYGLGFDNVSGYIHAATSSGINAAFAKRYTTTGTLVDSFQVGTFANGFVSQP